MTINQPGSRAVVLSSFDRPDTRHFLLYGCEDCACPVSMDGRLQGSGTLPYLPIQDTDRWECGQELLDLPLNGDHHILFNPLGRGGVVLVNEPARHILRRFQQPSSFPDAQRSWSGADDEFEQIFKRLAHLDMIQLSGQPTLPDFQRSTMLTAWLHVTNACNLRCAYCYVSKSNEGMDETVGRAAVEAVMRSAVEHNFSAVKLKYAGGEASLNYRLMLALHTYARELAAQHSLELHATLLSNGVALPQPLLHALQSEGIRLMISLDGIGRQHDDQRPFANGRASFHFVERTIARLIEQGHSPHLSITITNRNAAGLSDVVRFALQRDLTFSLNFFRDNDCAAGIADLKYEEQSMISALLEAFDVIEQFLPPWSVLGSILDRGQLLEPRRHSCGVGRDYVVIDQEGKVAKCHMEIERTLGDVFSSDPLQLVRRDEATAQNLPVEEKEGCRDCTWRYWCSGGCAVATFRATGRYDIKSPNCNIYKAIYPAALRLEGLRLLKYAPMNPKVSD
jgi:uncharacterized protein